MPDRVGPHLDNGEEDPGYHIIVLVEADILGGGNWARIVKQLRQIGNGGTIAETVQSY